MQFSLFANDLILEAQTKNSRTLADALFNRSRFERRGSPPSLSPMSLLAKLSENRAAIRREQTNLGYRIEDAKLDMPAIPVSLFRYRKIIHGDFAPGGTDSHPRIQRAIIFSVLKPNLPVNGYPHAGLRDCPDDVVPYIRTNQTFSRGIKHCNLLHAGLPTPGPSRLWFGPCDVTCLVDMADDD